MRAAVLTEVNRPLEILELEQEAPKAGEVRVQVMAAGVCMSDWHVMNGDWPLPLPMSGPRGRRHRRGTGVAMSGT
jgi:S-(hydroxymethyl)glutathione dehydrogenase / alcohol dehydrogenase